jgi:hypothetical protein
LKKKIMRRVINYRNYRWVSQCGGSSSSYSDPPGPAVRQQYGTWRQSGWYF